MSEQQNTQAPDIAIGDAPQWVEPIKVEPITVWTFDQATGAHIGEDVAQPDPLEAGRWLIPAGATDKAPPVVAAGEEAAHVAGAWVKRKKLPPVEPKGATLTPSQARRAQIAARLDDIDKASARSLRESLIAQGKGKAVPAFALTKLDALETEAVALRAEMAGLAT